MMGWAMYAASFFLPAGGGIREVDHGYQLVQETVFGGVLLPQVLAIVLLPNLAMLMTIPVLLGGKPPIARCLKWVLGLAGSVPWEPSQSSFPSWRLASGS